MKHKYGRHYSPELTIFAFTIHAVSPEAYRNRHITSMGITLVRIPHAASIRFVLALLSKVYVHHKMSAGYKKRVSWLKNNAGVVLYEYVRDAWTSWHHTATSVMQPESTLARYRQYSTASEPDWLRSSALLIFIVDPI